MSRNECILRYRFATRFYVIDVQTLHRSIIHPCVVNAWEGINDGGERDAEGKRTGSSFCNFRAIDKQKERERKGTRIIDARDVYKLRLRASDVFQREWRARKKKGSKRKKDITMAFSLDWGCALD